MSTNDIIFEIKSTIEELTEQAESLRDTVETTLNHAHDINERVVNRSERYVPLDEQPYGEELIRTDSMVESIDKQLTELEQVRDEEDLSRAVEIVQGAEEIIHEYRETFDDCFSDRFVEEDKKRNPITVMIRRTITIGMRTRMKRTTNLRLQVI